jgi:hypothetical protein
MQIYSLMDAIHDLGNEIITQAVWLEGTNIFFFQILKKNPKEKDYFVIFEDDGEFQNTQEALQEARNIIIETIKDVRKKEVTELPDYSAGLKIENFNMDPKGKLVTQVICRKEEDGFFGQIIFSQRDDSKDDKSRVVFETEKTYQDPAEALDIVDEIILKTKEED